MFIDCLRFVGVFSVVLYLILSGFLLGFVYCYCLLFVREVVITLVFCDYLWWCVRWVFVYCVWCLGFRDCCSVVLGVCLGLQFEFSLLA